jgi:hypothetical protein
MATVSYTYECDKSYAIINNPNEHKRFGYVTWFDGCGLAVPLKTDITCFVPFNNPGIGTSIQLPKFKPGDPKATQGTNATVQVVGPIEHFEWDGGVGGLIKCDFYMSQENAVQLKAVQQAVLKTTTVNGFGFWVGDYDQEQKLWYEQAFPIGKAISGIVGPKDNPELNVDLTPIPAADGIDVFIYKVSISIAPAANLQYALQFANSSSTPTVKQWGLVVGTLAAAQMKPSVPT